MGNALKQIADSDLPPVMTNMLASVEGMLHQALGPMGEGIHWLVFDSGGTVRSCAKGGLSVQYAGETYTYQTPIPGCPAN